MMLKEPVDKGPWVRRRREGTLALGGRRDSSAVSSTQAKLARNGREFLRATASGRGRVGCGAPAAEGRFTQIVSVVRRMDEPINKEPVTEHSTRLAADAQ